MKLEAVMLRPGTRAGQDMMDLLSRVRVSPLKSVLMYQRAETR